MQNAFYEGSLAAISFCKCRLLVNLKLFCEKWIETT